jgi:hypothetical protein
MDRFAGRIAIALMVCSLACENKDGEPTAPTSNEAVHVPADLPLSAPPGWIVRDHPSKQGKMLMYATKQNGFTPSINLLEDPFSGSLEQCVDLNLAYLLQQSTQFRQLTRGPFQTDGGLIGIKVTGISSVGKVQIHYSYYFFDWAAETKRIFTCCTLASQSKTMEPAFDGILKTYRPE